MSEARLRPHGLATALLDLAARRSDKPTARPADIAFAANESPPVAQRVTLALQQVAIQSVYFILPAVIGAAFGLSPAAVTGFLCTSIAVLALTALLQTLARGPVGSGYALPSIPAPAFVGVYMLVAAQGGDLGMAAGLMLATGVLGAVASLLLPRLQAVIPTEVAGVVVLMIGLSLLPRAYQAAGGASGGVAGGSAGPVLATMAILTVMIVCSLSHGRLGRFGVLIGTAVGCAICIPLGMVPSGAADLIAAAPWFALPGLAPPDLSRFDPALLPAFLIAVLASFASWSGDLVALQRASDGNWRRPDPAPLRRGMLAQSLGLAAAGLSGGMAPSSSSACVGLAIATRTLSRSVVVTGAALLFALACCPKLVSVVVLLPDPVKAAMLFHVCCFMVAAGCRLITSRMLDERRTFAVGLGIAAGVGAMIAPDFFARYLPSGLGAAVSAGAFVAIAMNLATLPLVVRKVSFELRPHPDLPRDLADRCEALGGAWGARRETMTRALHALIEVSELLQGRDIERFNIQLRYDEERVTVLVQFGGEELPAPSARPDFEDLEGALTAREAFALWLATRQADDFAQRRLGQDLVELRLSFAD